MSILFVLSAVCVIMSMFHLVSIIVGGKLRTPVMLLGYWDIEYSDASILTPALAFQVYWWASWGGLI